MPEKWTKEKVLEDAKKYTSIHEWRKASNAPRLAAYRHKIYEQATAHMIRKRKFWTDEEVIAEAKLYSSKKEWQKKGKTFSIGYRRNLFDIACKHMKPMGNYFRRQIYAIENGDKSVYVGLSYNPENRYKSHLRPDSKLACDKILSKHYNDGTQKLRIFETFYSPEEVGIKENEYIKKYREEGWKVLNLKKGGALGTTTSKYTREYCSELAKNCADRRDFELKYSSAHSAMCKWGWLDIISHLPYRKRYPYTEEEIQAAALQCKTRVEFYNNFNGHYQAAQARGILQKVIEHLSNKTKRKEYTREYCTKLVKECSDQKDFRFKHKPIYQIMHKNGWLDLLSHFPRINPTRRYTEEEIHAAALQCKTRGEFYKRFFKYYKAAQNYNILAKVTGHLPGKHKNKHKSKKI